MDNSSEKTNIDELLFHFVGLKAQVRALQHEMGSIYPTVVEVMKDLDEKREIGGAVVSCQTRKTYKSSENIRTLTEEIKMQKKHEIESGVAEVESVTDSVIVRFKKTEE